MAFHYFLFTINFIEILAAIIATINFKKYNLTTERYFLYFLWFTVFIESVASISGWCFNYNLVHAYIIYDFISFLFYILWYRSILTSRINKRIMSFAGFLFFTIAIFDFIIQDGKTTNKNTFICGSIIIIISSLLYFSELLKSNKVLTLKSELSFWIATGLLLFNVGSVPIEIFQEVFNSKSEVRIIISICLNLILYTCYSLGFIWSKKEKN